MKCKICSAVNKLVFGAKILAKYNISYFYCSNCNFLQTEEPYWLDEAYNEPINISDTGYIQRNLQLSVKVTILLSLLFEKNRYYLDHAGGYGVFVRLMRDVGFDFMWEDKYTENIFAKGFEYSGEPIEAITTFESFEHFVNPIQEIDNLLDISKNIIFSTMLLPEPIPRPMNWWYYGLDHGQHISFYSKNTFYFIAIKYNLFYTNIGSLHLLTENKISNLKLKTICLNGLLSRLYLRSTRKQLKSKTWSDHIKMEKSITK